MASGNPVVQVLNIMFPASTFPQMTVRAGGSTPAERNLAARGVGRADRFDE